MASDKERMKQLEEDNLKIQEENEKLRAQLLIAAAPKNDVGDPELATMKQEHRKMLGELRVALDQARLAAGLNIPKAPVYTERDIIKVSQGKGPDGKDLPPSPGSVFKRCRVTLPECGTKIIELWVAPGTEYITRDVCVKVFNNYMNVVASDRTHEWADITEGETVALPPLLSGASYNTINAPMPIDTAAAIATGVIRDPMMDKINKMTAELVA